jgi:hypothetical protein
MADATLAVPSLTGQTILTDVGDAADDFGWENTGAFVMRVVEHTADFRVPVEESTGDGTATRTWQPGGMIYSNHAFRGFAPGDAAIGITNLAVVEGADNRNPLQTTQILNISATREWNLSLVMERIRVQWNYKRPLCGVSMLARTTGQTFSTMEDTAAAPSSSSSDSSLMVPSLTGATIMPATVFGLDTGSTFVMAVTGFDSDWWVELEESTADGTATPTWQNSGMVSGRIAFQGFVPDAAMGIANLAPSTNPLAEITMRLSAAREWNITLAVERIQTQWNYKRSLMGRALLARVHNQTYNTSGTGKPESSY